MTVRIALLSNPNSGRNQQLQQFSQLADSAECIEHKLAANADEFASFVDSLLETPADLVVINAGDGTIQALLSLMFARLPAMPVLAVLKGGTTNMTGGDIGIAGNRVRGLKKLLAWAQDPQRRLVVETRPVLKVEWEDSASPVCGMFFGAGAIIEGIDYFHSDINDKGLRDSLGPALSALRIMFSLNKKEQKIFTPVGMMLEGFEQADSIAPDLQSNGKHLLAYASGLQHLFVGIKPFWGNGKGSWQFSAVRHQTKGYSLLKILPLFWGKPGKEMTAENGYLSRKLERLELSLGGEFTVDGERYATPANNPQLVVSLAGHVRFLKL